MNYKLEDYVHTRLELEFTNFLDTNLQSVILKLECEKRTGGKRDKSGCLSNFYWYSFKKVVLEGVIQNSKKSKGFGAQN